MAVSTSNRKIRSAYSWFEKIRTAFRALRRNNSGANNTRINFSYANDVVFGPMSDGGDAAVAPPYQMFTVEALGVALEDTIRAYGALSPDRIADGEGLLGNPEAFGKFFNDDSTTSSYPPLNVSPDGKVSFPDAVPAFMSGAFPPALGDAMCAVYLTNSDEGIEQLLLFISEHREKAFKLPDAEFAVNATNSSLNAMLKLARLEYPQESKNSETDLKHNLILEMLEISEILAGNSVEKLSPNVLDTILRRLVDFDESIRKQSTIDKVWVQAFKDVRAVLESTTIKLQKPQISIKVPEIIPLDVFLKSMATRQPDGNDPPRYGKAARNNHRQQITARSKAVEANPRDFHNTLKELYRQIVKNPMALVLSYDELGEKNNYRCMRSYIRQVRNNIGHETPQEIDKLLLNLLRKIADGPKQKGSYKQYNLPNILGALDSINTELVKLRGVASDDKKPNGNRVKRAHNRAKRAHLCKIQEVIDTIGVLAGEGGIFERLNESARAGNDILNGDVVAEAIRESQQAIPVLNLCGLVLN